MNLWLVFILLSLQTFAQGQQCGLDNLPVFQDSSNDTSLLNFGQQVIITTYQFNCFGEVTEWGAYVQLGRSNNTCVYIPTFQVWRPVGDGVYELVGENAYPAINLTQGSDIGMAAITPVYFQPGDVIGYYMDSTCNSSECGVRLDVNSSQHEVYYGPRVLNATFNITENMQLASNLAPILHIAVDNRSCPGTSTVTPSSTSGGVTSSPTSLTMTMTSSAAITVTSIPSTEVSSGTIAVSPEPTVPTPDYRHVLVAGLVPSLLLVFLLGLNIAVIAVCLGFCIKKRRIRHKHRDEFVIRLNEGVESPTLEPPADLHRELKSGLESENPMFSGSIKPNQKIIQSQQTISKTEEGTSQCNPEIEVANGNESDLPPDNDNPPANARASDENTCKSDKEFASYVEKDISSNERDDDLEMKTISND